MNKALYLLLFMLNREKEGSAFYNIALEMLKNLNTLQDINIKHIAKIANVSMATVSRFCREIGYEDFFDFKNSIKFDINNEQYFSHLNSRQIDYSADVDAFRKFYSDATAGEIQKTLQRMDIAAIDDLVREIHGHKNVAAFGLLHSEYACLSFQGKMMKLGKVVITLLDSKDQYRFLHSAGEDTLILLFSITGSYLINTLFKKTPGKGYVRDSKAKIALITENRDFPQPQLIDKLVYLGGSLGEDNLEILNNYALFVATDTIVYRYGWFLNGNRDI